MLLIVYSVAKAETIEGLFDDIFGLGTSINADGADVTVGDVLLEFSFAEDHGALHSPSCRTRQEDIGSMASTLQQRSWDSKSEMQISSHKTSAFKNSLSRIFSVSPGIAGKQITFKSQDVVIGTTRFE